MFCMFLIFKHSAYAKLRTVYLRTGMADHHGREDPADTAQGIRTGGDLRRLPLDVIGFLCAATIVLFAIRVTNCSPQPEKMVRCLPLTALMGH